MVHNLFRLVSLINGYTSLVLLVGVEIGKNTKVVKNFKGKKIPACDSKLQKHTTKETFVVLFPFMVLMFS
ncbi:unnamed protein product [Allacma fusca]|uniref:Uncharacterized protein n=1 Tax=Allacma fusca TaxID=39272 RepID=A0A8J2JSC3_9HEXA|nr:unnamed protein product [Allacma fusca]